MCKCLGGTRTCSCQTILSRTNKKTFEWQVAQHQCRQALLCCMAEREADRHDRVETRAAEDDRLPLTDSNQHHHISKTQQYPINVMKWMKENEHDLAVKVSHPKFLSSN